MKKKVFMVMPFSNEISNKAYEYCIKRICDEFDLDIRRADEIFTPNPVYDDIVKEIQDASIIIVDITGKNANVFYELGMAHTLKSSQTIIITQEEYKESPFDISHFRIIQYKDSIEGKEKFEEQLRKTLDNLVKDYRTINKEQFNLLIDLMIVSEYESELYALIGINQFSGTLHKDMIMHYLKGHSPNRGLEIKSGASIEESLEISIKMNFVKIENNLIILTDFGKAFVELLKEKGFVCEVLNDRIFTFTEEPGIQMRLSK